jgi:hypothetical protein
MELEIELLTGRTHQIRGQLAACNFPLVGDIQYGGAKQAPIKDPHSLITDRLALQCCELEFIDPDITTTKPRRDGTFDYMLTRSDRWNSFRIKNAWWTQYLNKYERDVCSESPLQDSLENTVESKKYITSAFNSIRKDLSEQVKPPNPNLLPPRVSLSRGFNKYVLIRAVHPAAPTQEEWFVKSATKAECGGEYHGKI